MLDNPSVSCDDNEEYDHLLRLARIFIFVWPCVTASRSHHVWVIEQPRPHASGSAAVHPELTRSTPVLAASGPQQSARSFSLKRAEQSSTKSRRSCRDAS
eukprot:152560-Prymnesium_polylepis.1